MMLESHLGVPAANEEVEHFRACMERYAAMLNRPQRVWQARAHYLGFALPLSFARGLPS